MSVTNVFADKRIARQTTSAWLALPIMQMVPFAPGVMKTTVVTQRYGWWIALSMTTFQTSLFMRWLKMMFQCDRHDRATTIAFRARGLFATILLHATSMAVAQDGIPAESVDVAANTVVFQSVLFTDYDSSASGGDRKNNVDYWASLLWTF
jgi:hypothetical protein